MAKRILGMLGVALFIVQLWPSAAMACGVTYEGGGGGNGDCGGSAPLIGVAAVYGAAGVTAVTLSVLSFLRGRMTPDELQTVLSSYLANPSAGRPWSRQPTGTRGGKPTGRRTRITSKTDAKDRRSLGHEDDFADVLADRGYRVIQSPTKREVADARASTGDSGDPRKNPDYLIEGHVFDCYSPTPMRSVRNIWSTVQQKIEGGQTQRVVLDLRDWRGDTEALQRQFQDWPLSGLKELVTLLPSGDVVQLVSLP